MKMFMPGDKLRFIGESNGLWLKFTDHIKDGLGIVSQANGDWVAFTNVVDFWSAKRFELVERPPVNLEDWIK